MSSYPSFRAGERWTYHAPEGFTHSRMIIGAVVTFADGQPIVCCAVSDAPRRLPEGHLDTVTIPFLPMRADALRKTVVERDGFADVPPAFQHAFDAWQSDPRGLSAFTVPFDGRLDRLIARQMADIVNVTAD